MKTKTKLLSLALALLMVLSVIATVPVVSAKSNATVNGVEVNVGDNVKITYSARSTDLWEDFQGIVNYDSTGLKYESFKMPNITSGLKGYNKDEAGKIYFSGSSLDCYDFTTESVLFTAEFTVIASGDYNVSVFWEVIDNEASKAIANSDVIDETKLSFNMAVESAPVEGNYCVSYFLTSVTSSNNTEMVKLGDTYTTTLTPEEGFEITSVSCTNGGEEVSPTTDEDSYVISIDSVAGDVVISAIATKKQTSTTTEPTTTVTEPTTTETEPTTTITEPTTTETEPTTTITEPTTTEAEPTTTVTEPITSSTKESNTIPTQASTKETEPTTTSSEVTTASSEETSTSAEATTASSEETSTSIEAPTVTTPAPVVKVTKISLNTYSKTLNVGKTYTLKATCTPDNAANKSVSWSSLNKKVATVTQSGKVTAKAKGTAYIKATAKDGSKKSVQCKITVKQPVTKVKLDVTKKTLKLKKSFKIKATVTPATANNKNVKWTVSKKNIVKLSKTTSASGKTIKVTAKKKGKVNLIATAADGSKKSATCKITVKK